MSAATARKDMLSIFIGEMRPQVADGGIQFFWAIVKAAHEHNLAAANVVHDDFLQLAADVELIPSNCHGREDIEHVIRWAMRGMNPFGKGPLR